MGHFVSERAAPGSTSRGFIYSSFTQSDRSSWGNCPTATDETFTVLIYGSPASPCILVFAPDRSVICFTEPFQTILDPRLTEDTIRDALGSQSFASTLEGLLDSLSIGCGAALDLEKTERIYE